MTETARFAATLALDAPFPLSGTALGDALNAQALSREAPAEVIRRPAGPDAAGCWTVDFGETVVTVLYRDTPAEADLFDEALARSRLLPEAPDVIGAHRAYFQLTHVQENADFRRSKANAVAMTRVLAALASLAPATAVHWGAGETLLPPARVRGLAQSLAREEWPLLLWINFLPYGGRTGPGGTPQVGMLTKGLAPFVGREIAFNPSSMDADQVFDRSVMLANYLLANGAVLGDGDTVGVSASERIRVRHARIESSGWDTYELTWENDAAA